MHNASASKDKLLNWITLCTHWLSDPEDAVQVEQWIDSAEQLMNSFEFSDQEQEYVDDILDKMEIQWKALLDYRNRKRSESVGISYDILDELLQRKQTEQRTTEWYQQMRTVISASEVGSLFASPLQRAKMVVSKTQPYQARNQPLAVCSDRMSAFDWGIRFEPVVKQIYEHKYGAEIKELGRLLHPTDSRCSASPDGLIYSCHGAPHRQGHLIEIKCPVTREIDGTVPKDYYAQMQMQLQVTGLQCCEYVEAVFASAYNQLAIKEGPSEYSGWIALIQYVEPKGDQYYYYVYSPINPTLDWKPVIQEGEEVIEITPWRLYQWSEQQITRNDEWWRSLQQTMEQFWEDVDKAKRGEFIVPESSRPSRKKAETSCIINFSNGIQVTRLDENGLPVS